MFRLMKLRPPSGWLAVGWELAIVTLGVLIALAAQQWAQERDWGHRVDVSRAALRAELAVQGANDPRVLQVESDELVAAVKANGIPVEYLLFSDEGHGFLRKQNRIAASEAYLRFLKQHLSSQR